MTVPAIMVDDGSSSTPIVLPNGGILYGGISFYDGECGHRIELTRTGGLAATYDFGWDTTPAIVGNDLDFKVVLKDSHYVSDPDGGPFFITELDASLQPVWQFASTETRICERQPDGTVTCVDDHPSGFEWSLGAAYTPLSIDRDGRIYALNNGRMIVLGGP
jgi:hypothetical protein